jgi:cell division transport system permease protein
MSTLLPRDKGAAPLEVVIGVMAFLAALALGASLITHRAAEGWSAGLSDRMTVQILPPAQDTANAKFDQEADAALAILRATPGVAHAAPLSQDEINKLLEPWIGKGGAVTEIPLPRLIDVVRIPGADINVPTLSAKLKKAAPDSVLDDHSRWIARLSGLTDAVVFSAYGILLLIAIATTAAVSFATRAGLDAHHEMVALLHQMGALPGFIARAVEWHYLVSALLAATVGAGLAAVFFLAMGGLESVGVEAVPFLPPLALKIQEIPWLLAVPVASALIAWVTARLSVFAVVRKIY